MAKNNPIEETLVTAFCKAWNNLDMSFIDTQRCDDMEYSSLKVLVNINVKNIFVNYLKGKLSLNPILHITQFINYANNNNTSHYMRFFSAARSTKPF